MGVFDCACVESGLFIDDRQQLVPIVATRPRALRGEPSWETHHADLASMTWEPLSLPIAGRYDSYGAMEDPDELDANISAIQAFATRITLAGGDASGYVVGELLEDIRGDGPGGTWNDRPVSFALVEDGIYRAIVDVVAANGETAWRRFAQVRAGDDDPTMRRLVDALRADPTDDAIRRVYVDLLLEREDPRGKLLAILPSLEEQSVDALAALVLPHAQMIYRDTELSDLRGALVDFVRFSAWGTTLSVTFGGPRFEGYSIEPEVLNLAKARYAEMPELLAAVAANDERWRQRFSGVDE